MTYDNQHVLRKGGITLYTRNGSPIYHCRLRIPGHPRYIIRTTKCTSLEEAIEFAEDLFLDLRNKAKNGLEVEAHTFASMWKKWLIDHRDHVSSHRLKYLEGTANRYFLPYFGTSSLESLSQAKVSGYWSWRRNYWNSAEGIAKIEAAQKTRTTKKRPYKQKLGNVAKVPAYKTLQMEQAALRQLFRWAHYRAIMNRMPEVQIPSTYREKGVSRRPTFDRHEWRQLYRFLREWVKEAYDPEHPEKRPNSMHRWHRELLRSYVLFMGNSGLRPNEARQLRWRDIEELPGDDGITRIVLHIPASTKTGYRECIPLQVVSKYLQRIKDHSNHKNPDDFVFCDPKGRPIDNFGKTFKKVLTEAGLLRDREGNVRTIYSLRHRFITSRLLDGGAQIEDLAQNTGTSPLQIFKHYRHITVRQKAKEHSGKHDPKMSSKGWIV